MKNISKKLQDHSKYNYTPNFASRYFPLVFIKKVIHKLTSWNLKHLGSQQEKFNEYILEHISKEPEADNKVDYSIFDLHNEDILVEYLNKNFKDIFLVGISNISIVKNFIDNADRSITLIAESTVQPLIDKNYNLDLRFLSVDDFINNSKKESIDHLFIFEESIDVFSNSFKKTVININNILKPSGKLSIIALSFDEYNKNLLFNDLLKKPISPTSFDFFFNKVDLYQSNIEKKDIFEIITYSKKKVK